MRGQFEWGGGGSSCCCAQSMLGAYWVEAHQVQVLLLLSWP